MKLKKNIFFVLTFSILLLGIIAPLFSPSLLVKAQTSFIDVYVYDAFTYDPIIGVDVVLFDDLYDHIGDGLTDITGYYQFSSLGIGDYYVEIYATGYHWNTTFIHIESEGEGRLVEFYQEPIFTPGNSFIDFYVYDAITLDPIVGANVILSNEFWEYITSGVTDIDGFYNFTGLGAAMYIVEVYAVGYEWEDSDVTIDFDGEGEYLELYLSPSFIPGNGFIDVYVYDAITLDPIVGADVELFSESWSYITSGVTDIDGFYNFTGLGAAMYIVEVYAVGYEWEDSDVTIDFDGEGEYLDFYLDGLPPRSITILSPTDSQIVAGGAVLVSFTVSDEINLDIVDIYVNTEYITTTYYEGNNELFVPVFQNGSNDITLYADWSDGSYAIDTVTIESADVIPLFPIEVGDFFHLKGDLLGSTEMMDQNFTFIEWLEPFVMNVSAIYHLYDDTGTIDILEGWNAVNVLNGYIPYSDGSGIGMATTRFIGFTGLPCPESTGTYPTIGDVTIFGMWNNIFTIIGSVTWKYTEVWILVNMYGDIMYAEKSTQMMIGYQIPGYIDLEIACTCIDCTEPIVFSPADVEYPFGDTSNSITWSATDMNPLTYTLYKDDVEIASDIWRSEIGIPVDVDGLAAGIYDFKIVFIDAGGNSAEDIVIVTVTPVVSEFNQIYPLLFLSTLILLTHTSIIYRKRKPSEN